MARFSWCRVRINTAVLSLFVFVSGGLNASIVQAQSATDTEVIYGDGGGISPELQRVRTLVRANVLDLAQSILETTGPQVQPTQQWLQWEQQLWALYRSRDEWQLLYDRTTQIPPSFPRSIQRSGQIQAVKALIHLQRGTEARAILRRQLLAADIAETDKREFRQSLIESYLADDMLNDAAIAMEKFQNDYRSKDEDWLLISAQVYMKLRSYNDAINLLAPLNSLEARLLRLYARVLNGSITFDQALQKLQILDQLIGGENDDKTIQRLDVLSVKIFVQQRNKSSDVVNDLEAYLANTENSKTLPDKSYPRFTVEDLHAQYRSNSLEVANLSGFLIGDEQQLFNFALQLSPEQMVTKKSVYGYLLKQPLEPEFKTQLTNLYVNTLIATNRTSVMPVLFGSDRPFSDLSISGSTGLSLSNQAIENGDIDLAAFINSGLDKIPQGMDPFDWLLHVARVSIIAGDYKTGQNNLHRLIDSHSAISGEQIDQILQPVFDLQTVNQHQYALSLLLKLESQVRTAKHEREISYWIAESYQATRQYIRAADYYLHSALLNNNGLDQWGESARFHAADSLQSANLYSDARSIFQGLLNRSSEEGRKAQLRQRIQELRLLESSL